MVKTSVTASRRDRALEQLVRHTVLPEFARCRPERVLLISPAPRVFSALSGWAPITLQQGGQGGNPPVACRTDSLPFLDDSFDAVLLHHVFADGREPELHEAWRVLSSGGDIFVLGHGSLGWRNRFGRGRSLPGLRVLQVCQQLRQRAFAIEQCAGSGILGIPVYWERIWQRPALPLADTVLIHGRHRPLTPIVRRLPFGRAQTVGARSVAADHLYRKAE